jgi:predicted nuclease with TOPRIM domain
LKSQQGKIISSLNNQSDKFNKLYNKFDELLKTESTLSEDNKVLKGKIETLKKKLNF